MLIQLSVKQYSANKALFTESMNTDETVRYILIAHETYVSTDFRPLSKMEQKVKGYI